MASVKITHELRRQNMTSIYMALKTKSSLLLTTFIKPMKVLTTKVAWPCSEASALVMSLSISFLSLAWTDQTELWQYMGCR